MSNGSPGQLWQSIASAAQTAAEAWAAAMANRKNCCIRPPWEEMQFFDTVVGDNFSLTDPLVSTQVVKQNPMRVGVWFSVAGANSSVLISTKPTGIGFHQPLINLTTGQFPVTFRQQDDGLLAQCDWYALQNGGNPVLYTLELLLRDWPAPQQGITQGQ